jgi:hypothetical protein
MILFRIYDLKVHFVATGDGKFRAACNRQYYLSNVAKTQTEAAAECCKFGMKLLSVETEEEYKCLGEMNRGYLQIHWTFVVLIYINFVFWRVDEMANKDSSYWTSGTNNGVGCDEIWGWCSTKTLFQNPFKMWMSGAPFAQITKRCAQMNMNADPTKVVFEDCLCSSIRYFICEVIFDSKEN